MKKRHLIAAGIVVAVLALVVPLWVGEGPLWRWVMTKEYIQDYIIGNHPVRSTMRVSRWSDRLASVSSSITIYYLET